ncbi:hypothetical protein F444_03481 [Phytophthora nicotianae P1976]|uniref:Uncharacterized protein n=1 Tax=Phytophthora nicotianae P1976 TaxID=1317066 RepID=A0A081AU17_PHYNI|nr:hypothetical protein F444_03481 [Phytophthora nicotianae P1976]
MHKVVFGLGAKPYELVLSLKQGEITIRVVLAIIKKAASWTELNSSRYSAQSVGFGGAMAFVKAESDRLVIKRMCRWMANAYEDYPMTFSSTRAEWPAEHQIIAWSPPRHALQCGK